MRLSKYILLFVVAVLCVATIPLYATVKLSGRIQHKVSDSIKVSYNDNRLAYYPKEYYAAVDKNGNFSLEFPLPPKVYMQVEIQHGKHFAELMLRDNDSLAFTVDEEKFDSTAHYTGRGADVQNFVAKHSLVKGRINQYAQKLRGHIEREPADFLKWIEGDKKNELDFLNDNKAKLPATFVKLWEQQYRYYNYFFIQQYPQMHQMMKLRRYTDTIPQENFVVLKNMPNAFDDEMLQLPSYLLYLSGVFEVRLKAAQYCYPATDSIKLRKLQDSLDVLGYKQLPDKSGEYFIAQSLYPRIKNQNIDRTRAQFAAFKKRWKDSEYIPMLAKQIEKTESLLPGQPAPDIDIVNAEGKQIKLSDLKGKVVYLGFWAKSCKQCIGEMIAEKKVKDVLKNKPVEFVYVSIDQDTTGMARMLGHYSIDGNFAWTKGGWYAKEVGLYGVQSMPAYFLIDREGNFAVQNPPAPPQTTDLIVAISKLY